MELIVYSKNGVPTGVITPPASSTDNAIARWDGTTGKALQDSGVTVDDGGIITFPTLGGVSSLRLWIGTFKGEFFHANTVNRTWTFPNYDGTMATLAGTETFTNKTLTSPTISGGGTADSLAIGGTTPASGTFSALRLKIGGWLAILSHTNSADHTYSFPDYDGTIVTIAGSETLTNKTLTTPTIGNFTNAQHAHANAAGGGQINPNSAFSSPVNPTNGGTGQNFSASSGLVKVAAGSFSVVTAPSGAVVGDTDSQTLTNKTLTTPTIGSFTNATHNHQNAAGGGQLDAGNVFSAGLVPQARGGTHTDLSGTGGSSKVVMQESVGADLTVRVLAAGDIPSLAASKITSGTFDLARVVSGSAGNRQVATAFSGDTVLTLRNMGGYEFSPYTVLSGNAANLTISSIPSGFNILVLHLVLRTDRAANTNDGVLLRPNADSTASHYFADEYFLRATVANVENLGATASVFASIVATGATASSDYFGALTVTIENYASSSHNRLVYYNGFLALNDTSGNLQHIAGGCTWKDPTNPITSLTILPQNGSNFVSGSASALFLF